MGHYTAVCHSSLTRTWHCFDDSAVREVQDSHVQSSNAYVLLYSRKPFPKPKISGLWASFFTSKLKPTEGWASTSWNKTSHQFNHKVLFWNILNWSGIEKHLMIDFCCRVHTNKYKDPTLTCLWDFLRWCRSRLLPISSSWFIRNEEEVSSIYVNSLIQKQWLREKHTNYFEAVLINSHMSCLRLL